MRLLASSGRVMTAGRPAGLNPELILEPVLEAASLCMAVAAIGWPTERREEGLLGFG